MNLNLERTCYGEKIFLESNFLMKKIIWSLSLGLLLVSCLISRGYAQNTNSLIFDQPNSSGIGPRAMGMGNAFSAVADDTSAVYWNPAGLVQIPAYALSLSSAPIYFQQKLNGVPLFGEPYYASIQFVAPISQENTLAISLFRNFHPQIDFFTGNTSLSLAQQDEASYLLNPSFQADELVLSYAADFASFPDFSIGVNVKSITNDRYYISNFPINAASEPGVYNALQNPIRVRGFGVDLGFLYRIPLTKYTQELRAAVVLKNLVSRVDFLNGLIFNSTSGVAFNIGPGFETQVPPEAIIGVAYKNNAFFGIRNITDIDFDQISDPRYNSNNNKYIRVGTEFWLFHDILGIRGGYETLLSTPGTLTLGASVRALNGDFETDIAYLKPISPNVQTQPNSQIATLTSNGVNFEDFYIGLSYYFGQAPAIPPPTVHASVFPQAFQPSQGQTAAFALDTSEGIPIKNWNVFIYNSQNQLVRNIGAQGNPPTTILWGGENNQFQPLPPGVYTWAFQVRDRLNHVGATRIHSVEILPPPISPVAPNPAKLYTMRQQQVALLNQERQQLSNLAQKEMQKLLAAATPNTAPAYAGPVSYVTNAAGNTTVPSAGPVPVLGFTNLPPQQVLNVHFRPTATGQTNVVINYQSRLDYVPYIYQEAGQVIRSAAKSLGTSTINQVITHVYYGKNEMTIQTPSAVALEYAHRAIRLQQTLNLSTIVIDGQKVAPNGI
jgi:hypothetical protein